MQATDIQEPEWLALIAARPEFAVPTPADWWPQHYPLYKLFATVRDECGELNAKTVTAYCDRYFSKHFGECTDDSDPLAEGVNDWLTRGIGGRVARNDPEGSSSPHRKLLKAYVEFIEAAD
jgi:hypothetical protein